MHDKVSRNSVATAVVGALEEFGWVRGDGNADDKNVGGVPCRGSVVVILKTDLWELDTTGHVGVPLTRFKNVQMDASVHLARTRDLDAILLVVVRAYVDRSGVGTTPTGKDMTVFAHYRPLLWMLELYRCRPGLGWEDDCRRRTAGSGGCRFCWVLGIRRCDERVHSSSTGGQFHRLPSCTSST